MKYLLVLVMVFSAFTPIHAVEARKISVAREFRRTHPCPATGKIQDSCKGYVVDHIIPLCADGPDTVENMMWQEEQASYKKDTMERAICRRLTLCTKPK